VRHEIIGFAGNAQSGALSAPSHGPLLKLSGFLQPRLVRVSRINVAHIEELQMTMAEEPFDRVFSLNVKAPHFPCSGNLLR